jgi:hypothetical protein
MIHYQITLDDTLLQRLFQNDGLKPLLEQVLNQALQAQVTEQIGAAPHQRTEERTTYRNGFGERVTDLRLLRGKVFCSRARLMRTETDQFHCNCRQQGTNHPAQYVDREAVEAAVLRVLDSAVCARNEGDAPAAQTLTAEERAASVRDKRRLVAEKARLERNAASLMEGRAEHVAIFGEVRYRQTCEETMQELAKVERRLETIEDRLSLPVVDEDKSLLYYLQEWGFRAFWDTLSDEGRQKVVDAMLQRVDLLPPPDGQTHTREIRVTLAGLWGIYLPPQIISLRSVKPHYQTVRAQPVTKPCSHCGAPVTRPKKFAPLHFFCCDAHYRAWRSDQNHARAADPHSFPCTCGRTDGTHPWRCPRGRALKRAARQSAISPTCAH